jgi:ribonuclease T2
MMKSATTLVRPLLTAVVLALLLAVPATAQRMQPQDRSARNVAGAFDYYTLVLSWSPTYCATQPSNESDPQCRLNSPRPYAFVLHGLWPQYENGFPEYCHTRERPFVPRRTIDNMLDIMPSPRLVIHEYRKHGTCSGLDPVSYYDLSRKLFEKIKIPERFVAPEKAFFVTPGEVADAFMKANPDLDNDMLAVECRGSGNRLREIRICFSREGNFRACGSNEHPRRLCSAGRMYVPPVRGGGASILPGPRGQRSL